MSRMFQLAIAAIAVSVVTAEPSLAQQSCAGLLGLTLDRAVVTSATIVPAGPYVGPLGPAGPPLDGNLRLPTRCEVRGTIATTPQSQVHFALWLPLESWNGKYRQEGNSGFAGLIPYWSMVDALVRGYATAGTDNGHTVGDWTETLSGAWAIGAAESVIDFGNRAVHETATQAKTIITRFYGRPASHNYFIGCSEGGREALMEAQRFPTDFDGILAAAPANDLTRLAAGFIWNEQAVLGSAASFSATTLRMIQGSVLRQCDALDGITDGLLSNPESCRFDPAVLQCHAQVADADCLSSEQVGVLRRIYAGPSNQKTGRSIFPGYPPGHEGSRGWATYIMPAKPEAAVQFALGNSYFGQIVHQRADWDFRTFDPERDVSIALETIGPYVDATSEDLRSFQAAGGKLLQYHGWADAVVSPLASIEYRRAVATFLEQVAPQVSVDDFYRLFMVPGMAHCGGGIGPNMFGSVGTGVVSLNRDPTSDVFSALESWVEQKRKPDHLIGSGFSSAGNAQPLTRPICAYPAVARYAGRGDINDATHFTCQRPGQ